MSFIKKEFTFPSTSGLADIHCASYLPENGEIKAVMQIAHGMAEHHARYEKFISVLCDKGIAVYINDHLGHGKSVKNDDELGYFGDRDGWKCFVEDCCELSIIAKQENEGKPFIFFGHSMGSFIARAFSFKYAKDIDGAIFCGTAGPNPAAGAGIALTKVIKKLKGDHHRSKLINSVGFGTYNSKFEDRTPFDWLTRDNDEVDKYIADPYCGFLFTAPGYCDLFSLLGYVSSKEWFAGFNKQLPVLMISGDMDPVGEYGKGVKKVEFMLRAEGKENLETILYKDARHEILNESQCFDTVCEDVIAWIEKTIA